MLAFDPWDLGVADGRRRKPPKAVSDIDLDTLKRMFGEHPLFPGQRLACFHMAVKSFSKGERGQGAAKPLTQQNC